MRSSMLLVLPALAAVAGAVKVSTSAQLHLNPIRKVVTLLQMMQKKVEEEGAKEKELYSKFVCYCKNSGGSLSDSIAAAEANGPKLTSQIKSSEEEKAQNEEDLKSAQSDRAEAKTAMNEATSVREKDAAAFAATKADLSKNIEMTAGAVKALEKGAAGTFLQTRAASALKTLVQSKTEMLEEDRNDILAFLSNDESAEYAPQSGEITGILKQMGDEMSKDLADATAAEESAISDYESLMAAKKKEIDALTAAIETKMTRIGELAVSIEQMKNELTNSEEQLAEDKKMLANLEKACGQKKRDWEARQKTRADELVAIADTIKVLNDDDALELFKKTLPSAASLMQVGVTATATRARALAKVRQVRSNARRESRAKFDVILLALHGKKIGFEKVLGMIDQMVGTLKAEQTDDDDKKEYCGRELDNSDDKKKALEKSISDADAAIASAKDGIANVKDEMAALSAGITALDKSVAEATAQRKQENADYKEVMSSDAAAKELLGFAKNRLNKFYNPKLYKPAPKTELSQGDRIFANEGGQLATPPPSGIAGTGIEALAQVSKAEPPKTFGATYEKKSEENSGVIAMINLLINDLDKEMTEASAEEKDAQADYEELMKDSAEKRATDSQALEAKAGMKADLEGDLEDHRSGRKSDKKELGATHKYISQLHSECDWLMQYFEVRKTARASEIDALGNAKAVLSGADYSLLQENSKHRTFLRHSK